MRLTDEELRDLTGYQRPSKQIAWLKQHMVRFFVAADGHPRVLRAHLAQPETVISAQETRPWMPWEKCNRTPMDWLKHDGPLLILSERDIIGRSKPCILEDVPNQAGIYFLLVGKRIMYVGLSININARLCQHKKTRPFDHYFCTTDIPELFLPEFEAFYIARHNPEWNDKFPPVPCELQAYL